MYVRSILVADMCLICNLLALLLFTLLAVSSIICSKVLAKLIIRAHRLQIKQLTESTDIPELTELTELTARRVHKAYEFE